ncbi:MAG: hypothetical protein NTW93_01460 [Phycisphaerae bacterium]|nr:hypothetical protein [Phycisphaerae bacterium]
MAKRKRHKKTSAARYIEKISSQISDIIKKDLEKSFRLTPADAKNVKKIKKKLAGLRKQVEKRLKEGLKKIFKAMPAGRRKKGKKKK